MNLKYLRECRMKKFKNRESAAKIIGISIDMYTSIELGRRNGTVGTIMKLCKELDMDANILLNLKENV